MYTFVGPRLFVILLCGAVCALASLPLSSARGAHLLGVAHEIPCGGPSPHEGIRTCYAPSERAIAEARLPVSPVNPDVGVAQVTALPLTGLVTMQFVTKRPTDVSSIPVGSLIYNYGGVPSESSPNTPTPYVSVDEIVENVAPFSATVYPITDTDHSGQTLTFGWYLTEAAPGRGLTLRIYSNIGGDTGLTAVRTIGQAILRQEPIVTSTANSTTGSPPPSGTTTLPLSFTASVIRDGLTIVRVHTAPQTRLTISIGVLTSVNSHRAITASRARWTTKLRRQATASTQGWYVGRLRLPIALPPYGLVRITIDAVARGKTATANMIAHVQP